MRMQLVCQSDEREDGVCRVHRQKTDKFAPIWREKADTEEGFAGADAALGRATVIVVGSGWSNGNQGKTAMACAHVSRCGS